MKKTSLAFLLFLSIISLVSCSITKRRYTGGYDVSWHSKPTDAKPINQVRVKPVPVNKIAKANNAPSNPIAAPQTKISATQRIAKAISYSLKEIPKSIISPPIPNTYSGIPGHDEPKKR